ncbi:MAG: hypothetical protein JWP36_229 [Paucimonas sp.]|nr:hypothetical protein [Paucimonas sp.]
MAAENATAGTKRQGTPNLAPGQAGNAPGSQPLSTGQQQQTLDSQARTVSPPRVKKAVEKKVAAQDELRSVFLDWRPMGVSPQAEDPPVITHPRSQSSSPKKKANPQSQNQPLSSPGGTAHTGTTESLSPRGPNQNDAKTSTEKSVSSHSTSSNPTYSGSDQSAAKNFKWRKPMNFRQPEDFDITRRTEPDSTTTTTTTTFNAAALPTHSSNTTPPSSQESTQTRSQGSDQAFQSISSDSPPYGGSSSGHRSSPDYEQRSSRTQKKDVKALPARAISHNGNARLSLKIHTLEEKRPKPVQFEAWKLCHNVTKKKSHCIDKVAEGYANVEKLDPQAIQTTVSTGFGKQFKKDRAKKIQLVVDGVVAKRTIFQSAGTLRLFRQLCTLLYEYRRKSISVMNAALTKFAIENEEGLKRLEGDLKAASLADTFFMELTGHLRNLIILNKEGTLGSTITFQEEELKALLDQLDPQDTPSKPGKHRKHSRQDKGWRNSAPPGLYTPIPGNKPVTPLDFPPRRDRIEGQPDSGSQVETTSTSQGSKNTPRSDHRSGGSSLATNESQSPLSLPPGSPVWTQTETLARTSGVTLSSSPFPEEVQQEAAMLSEAEFKEALLTDLDEYAIEGIQLYGEEAWNVLVGIATSLGDREDNYKYDLVVLTQPADLKRNTRILRDAAKKTPPPELEFIAFVVKLAAKAYLKRAGRAMMQQTEPRSPSGQEKHSD